MPKREKILSELSHIIESHILLLGARITEISTSEIDIEAEKLFGSAFDLLKKRASEGLLRTEAESIVMKLLDTIDINEENIENEIKLGALNSILCSIVGFCSPHLLIWNNDTGESTQHKA